VSIENPRDNSPNTIDCASCHIAASTENLIAKPLLSLDDETSPLAFQPNRAFVSSADMAATFNTADEHLDVHAFSYVARSPSISQRVVNETASVVAYLNQLPSD
jgi:hypothetical protein